MKGKAVLLVVCGAAVLPAYVRGEEGGGIGHEFSLSASATTPYDNIADPVATNGLDSVFVWVTCARSEGDLGETERGAIGAAGRLTSSNGSDIVLGFDDSLASQVVNISSTADEMVVGIGSGCGGVYPRLLGHFVILTTTSGATYDLAPLAVEDPDAFGLLRCATPPGNGYSLATAVRKMDTTSSPELDIDGKSYGCAPVLVPQSNTDDDNWVDGFSASTGYGIQGDVYVTYAVSPDSIFYGGAFTQVSQAGVLTASRKVAMWDGAEWLTDATSFQANSVVYDFEEYDSELLAGGTFDASPAERVAKLTGSGWVAFADDGLNNTVLELETLEGDLYAGGSFTASDSTADLRGIARWEDVGGRWMAIGAGFDRSGGARSVRAIELYDGVLYAGGHFQTSDTVTVSSIAMFDGSNWQPLIADGGTAEGIWQSDASDGVVYDLAVFDGYLVVAGAFDRAGDVHTEGLALWDGCAWYPFFQTGPGSNPSVRALEHYNYTGLPGREELIFTGDFGILNGFTASDVARWNGTVLSTFGSGLTGTTGNGRDVTTDGYLVYFGGGISQAGVVAATNVAVWSEPPVAVPEIGESPRSSSLRDLVVSPVPSAGPVRISFETLRRGEVTVRVFDVAGRLVEQVYRGELGAGHHSLGWSSRVVPGTYFLRVNDSSGSSTASRIVILR